MKIPDKLIKFIEAEEKIRVAYLFGSRAENITKAADWDFGFIIDDSIDAIKSEWFKYELESKISNILKTDAVDICILNFPKSIELANAIVRDGQCFLNRYPKLDTFERNIFHEYLDHKASLKRNGFTV